MPGALAAFVVDCSIFPLDTIKSRIQAADYRERYPQGRGLYSGLWQGFGPVVLATLPSAALFFTTYEHAKSVLTSAQTPIIGAHVAADSRAQAVAHTASSALAELAACLILTPAETIKQRMQVATASSRAADKARPPASLTMASVWRSYWALAGRNLPFTAMHFPLYEYFRSRLARRVGLPERKGAGWSRAGHQSTPLDGVVDDAVVGEGARRRAYQTIHRNTAAAQSASPRHYLQSGLVSGTSAAAAGAISALATTPLDLVKTRTMLQAASERPPSMWSIARDIWQREGIVGLMRGGALRCAWTALGAGIYLGAYEAGREWWNEAGKEQAQDMADQAGELVDSVRA